MQHNMYFLFKHKTCTKLRIHFGSSVKPYYMQSMSCSPLFMCLRFCHGGRHRARDALVKKLSPSGAQMCSARMPFPTSTFIQLRDAQVAVHAALVVSKAPLRLVQAAVLALDSTLQYNYQHFQADCLGGPACEVNVRKSEEKVNSEGGCGWEQWWRGSLCR